MLARKLVRNRYFSTGTRAFYASLATLRSYSKKVQKGTIKTDMPIYMSTYIQKH